MAITTSAREIVQSSEMALPDDLPEQFWELVELYRGELINQAFAILGSVPDAEDVVQESFCEVVRQPDKLVNESSIGGWLRTINRANALNRLRNRKRDSNRVIRKQQEAPDRTLTTGGFSGMEICEAVAKAIDTLPADLRRAVVMRYWEHLSYDDIAARMKVSPRTVRRLFHDASVQLYQRLKNHVDGDAPPVK